MLLTKCFKIIIICESILIRLKIVVLCYVQHRKLCVLFVCSTIWKLICDWIAIGTMHKHTHTHSEFPKAPKEHNTWTNRTDFWHRCITQFCRLQFAFLLTHFNRARAHTHAKSVRFDLREHFEIMRAKKMCANVSLLVKWVWQLCMHAE